MCSRQANEYYLVHSPDPSIIGVNIVDHIVTNLTASSHHNLITICNGSGKRFVSIQNKIYQNSMKRSGQIIWGLTTLTIMTLSIKG
jgi:hypothetical protein